MSSNKKIAEFPDVEAKLHQPSKQSAFERQKAEAEAKKRREAAETAAVLQDFVKSFDHDDDTSSSPYGQRAGPSRFGSGPPERPAFGSQTPYGGPGKRHFGISASTPKSGPGSLGPVPSSFGKKRHFDGSQQGFQREADDVRGRLGFEDREPGSLSKAFDASDDEDKAVPAVDRAEEKAISKPTLRLANLPPGTSPAFIKTIIPPNLTVENVKIVPPTAPGSTERRSIAAIVTLSKETPATEIDAAVSTLQNRYLGLGYFLSIHRHLSSAAIASGLTTLASSSTTVSNPFGAKRVEDAPVTQGPLQIGHGRGYAPPSSYGPPLGGPLGRGGLFHVPVKPPKDIRKLRMIHTVIEMVLEFGVESEALLMSRPNVQRDEEWAWIWDARSEDAVYYRFTLWKIITGFESKTKYVPLFDGSHAWKTPDQPLAYEYTTTVDEFVSDSEYHSDDEEDFEDEQNRQAEPGGGVNEQEDTFLNPLDKAKLTHLLARLPTTLSRIRKGDIARITAFAITHASRGASEIVDMIISNIELPFAYTSANLHSKAGRKDKDAEDAESREASPAPGEKSTTETTDMSAARLLGLYVINDVLSSASTSGIRHAWRYRQHFEVALRKRKTFELLGSMGDKLNWGRLRADKWKRSVGLVLNLWEGWCVFPVETHAFFVNSFENPPLPAKEPIPVDTTKKDTGRWKPVEAAVGGRDSLKIIEATQPASEHNPSGHPSPTAEGQEYLDRILETGDTDGDAQSPRMQYSSGIEELFSDEDLDGDPDEDLFTLIRGPVSHGDTDMGGLDEKAEGTATSGQDIPVTGFKMTATKAPPSRKRMRAVDMFAGSDSEDGG
ncbi:U2 snRNP-associated SURP motif-containing protein [Echria macrotheca]|uniref:U2 snRNP-associated SURP motif-containing protein n=1 Tax=Echria macrotheca TaxID=438768 RepID=A0AAJ0BKM0_9PEZI|nr:U2 snRNP-associated SURP motif-containing protein [Echria macrotheca]